MSVAINRKKKWIQAAVIIALMVLVGFIPPFEPLTADGMRVLGILIGCIYAWSIGELIWPSILSLILLGFMGENTVTGIFSSAYGNQNVLMVLFCMIMCYGIEQSGLLQVITKWILSKRFAQKGPWWLCFAFCIASAVAAIVTCASIPVAVLCWAIFYDVCDTMNLERRSPYVTVVMVSIAIASYLGGIVMPYAGFSQVCFGLLKSSAPDITISFAPYSLTMLIVTIVAIPVIVLFSKFVFRIKVDWNFGGNLFEKDQIKLTKNHKIIIFYLVILCVLMVIPNYLPADSVIRASLTNLGVMGTICLVCIAMALSIDKNGESILDLGKGVMYGMPWGLFFMLGTAMVISPMITSESTGISVLLTNILNPLVEGRSAAVFMAIMIVFGIILTNCINNIVCCTLLIPISVTFLSLNGGNPAVLVSLFCMALTQGVAMPAGSAVGAMLHGQTEWLTSTMVYKYAFVMEVVLAVVMSIIGIPIGNILFANL
ncbi:MAG: SLC13 family permease [Peptococcaceae bacterium]|nr:SLC13 family permease [Peptococcaceae bacterium]